MFNYKYIGLNYNCIISSISNGGREAAYLGEVKLVMLIVSTMLQLLDSTKNFWHYLYWCHMKKHKILDVVRKSPTAAHY